MVDHLGAHWVHDLLIVLSCTGSNPLANHCIDLAMGKHTFDTGVF